MPTEPTAASTLAATEHQREVLRYLREFHPEGWALPLLKQHDGSHSVLSRMAEAGLITVVKEPGLWTYKA